MSEKNDIREIKKTADELAAKLEKGEMKLLTPIRGGGKDIDALKYDFTKLTAWEYAEALDSDAAAKDAFKMTKKQGIALFAAAVAKEMPELDARDACRIEGRFDLIEQAAAARALAAEMNQNLFAALRADEVAILPLGIAAEIDVGGRIKFKIAHGKNLQL